MNKQASKSSTTPLPMGIKESDFQYPKAEQVLEYVPLYEVEFRSGQKIWCAGVLKIGSRAAGLGYGDRTYAIRLPAGTLCRIGGGPHVKSTRTLYLSEKRAKELKEFVAALEKGRAEAGQVRDRVSSRRVEGQLRRMRGERSWRWEN